MGSVTSKDGTRLAWRQTGDGPPLVLVHGTGGSVARWRPILPVLEERFSVYALDRRGRGESGDGEGYAIEREFEDVAAVVEAIGGPVFLLGHSYGAICALEAARLTLKVRKLILYEPPVPVEGVRIYAEGMIERLEALLARGDREGVLTTFMREVVRMPPSDFEAFRSSPAWPARVAAAHTLPRELRAHEGYRFVPERFAGWKVPTLMMVGGDSPAFFKEAVKLVGNNLPDSRTVVLAGQQHIAIDTAPGLFVDEVVRFLGEA